MVESRTLVDPVDDAPVEGKGWYESRTVWSGVVGGLMGIAALFGLHTDKLTPELTAQIVSGLMTIGGIISVVLRLKTSGPIK